MVSWVNAYRQSSGLSPLVLEHNLEQTAEKYAAVLTYSGRLSHIDAQGKRVLDRYRDEGGTATHAGEILGTSRALPEIFAAWKQSQTHRMVILDPQWLRIGSHSVYTNGVYTAVVLFSNSIIRQYKIIFNHEGVRVEIAPLLDRVIFSPAHKIMETVSEEEKPKRFSFPLAKEQLPLVLPLYTKIEGLNKITDFLYIKSSNSFKTIDHKFTP